MKKIFMVICLFIPCALLLAQRKVNYTKVFQASLVPGISTNGMHPGGYHNFFSLNLTSGYSASTYLLEVGGVSNLNVQETRGLQFAGIANLTGSNAFAGMQPKEKDEKIKTGYEANLSGAQFSGIANVVLNNVFGWQATGGVNLAKGALQGIQMAGVANLVYKYSFGIQLAGLWNVSVESMDGVQLAGLSNFTDGGLYGAQLSVFNRAGFIEGKNSYERKDPTAIQIGLFNMAGKMNGFQVGLVNVARQMQGTQIGLVNIYKDGNQAETRDGTSIGLLNMGSTGYAALYANELFFVNVEIATGTMKNSRIKSESKNIYIQNALIYAKDPSFMDKEKTMWAMGYGLKKFYFNRSTTPGMSNFRFFSFGMDFLHVNHEQQKITQELSLLTRPKVSFGTRLHPKLHSVYLFAGVSYNFYLTDSVQVLAPSFLETSANVRSHRLEMWPGLSAGLHIQ